MAQPGGLSETQQRDDEQDHLVKGPVLGQGSDRGNGAAGSAVTWYNSGREQGNNGTRGNGNSLANEVRVETCSFRKG